MTERKANLRLDRRGLIGEKETPNATTSALLIEGSEPGKLDDQSKS